MKKLFPKIYFDMGNPDGDKSWVEYNIPAVKNQRRRITIKEFETVLAQLKEQKVKGITLTFTEK